MPRTLDAPKLPTWAWRVRVGRDEKFLVANLRHGAHSPLSGLSPPGCGPE